MKKPPKGVKRVMKSKKAGKTKPEQAKKKAGPTKPSAMIARAMALPDDDDADDVGDHEFR